MGDYSEAQLDYYLELLDRIAGNWGQVFPEVGLQLPEYWYLFIGLYKNRTREVTKGDAGDLLTAAGIRSPAAQAKVIAHATSLGYVREQKSKVDNRVNVVRMTPKLQKKIQEYLSEAFRVMSEELNLR